MVAGSRYQDIVVVGLGYIGLPTAAVFAKNGVNVYGMDVDQRVVDTINRGEIHIVEPDLDSAVKDAVAAGMMEAGLSARPADAFLIAVPTPFKGHDHEPDLSYIEAASRSIAPVLKTGDLVILESTSPVGATEKMAEWLAEERPDLSFPQQEGEQSDIRIAHCPERVLPGKVLAELVTNDRIVGGMTQRCGEAAKALYEIFVEGECILTDVRTAEMCKLTENAFRDVNIAFANELSLICEKQGINVWELIQLANRHPRVDVLSPGAGVGGHCIAVDPWFIIAGAPAQSRLIRTAREVNNYKPEWVIERIEKAVRDSGKTHPTIALLGLAFKPDIDDLRESPAMRIAAQLVDRFEHPLLVVEPNIETVPAHLQQATLTSLEEALGADVVAILVGHREFHGAREQLARHPLVIDPVGVTGGLVQSRDPGTANLESEMAKAAIA